jgi:hypothetical protein
MKLLKSVFEYTNELQYIFDMDDSSLIKLRDNIESSFETFKRNDFLIVDSNCFECDVVDEDNNSDSKRGSSSSFSKSFHPFLLMPTKIVQEDSDQPRKKHRDSFPIEKRNKMTSVCEDELLLVHYMKKSNIIEGSTENYFEKGNTYFTHDVIYTNSFENWEWNPKNSIRILIRWGRHHPYLSFCRYIEERGNVKDHTFILPPCAWIVEAVSTKKIMQEKGLNDIQVVEVSPLTIFSDMDSYWEDFYNPSLAFSGARVSIMPRSSFSSMYKSITINCFGKVETVSFQDSFRYVCYDINHGTGDEPSLWSVHIDKNVLKRKEEELNIRFYEIDLSPFVLSSSRKTYKLGKMNNLLDDPHPVQVLID